MATGDLDVSDFPALYRATDQESLSAQVQFFVATRTRLGGLIVAAIGGALTWEPDNVKLGALLALIAFLVAVGAELLLAIVRPERTWYEGRAAAESVKTIAWRYMVRGKGFDKSDDEAQGEFGRELKSILHDLPNLDAPPPEDAEAQITSRMREVRALTFSERRDFYRVHRVGDQRSWYATKAASNKRAAFRWTLGGISLEITGIVGAVGRLAGWYDFDLLGVLGAIGAAAVAWSQAKQFGTLATAYSVTAQELAAVNDDVAAVTDESQWASVMDEAEEAISREHTLWRASRGVRTRTPKS